MASLLSNPTLILGLLAAQSLAIPAPLPSATAAPVKRDDLSCWDKVSDGQVFQATNAQWDIICGTDYALVYILSATLKHMLTNVQWR